jgi:hypothetical protein
VKGEGEDGLLGTWERETEMTPIIWYIRKEKERDREKEKYKEKLFLIQ